MFAPIALFTYNRPEHTRATLQALSEAELASSSTLYVFSDGPKSENDISQINAVRSLVMSKKWCKSVELIERDENVGLAPSITSGVTKILSAHNEIIVLEDDIVLATDALKFLNSNLNTHKDSEKTYHISAYNWPIQMKRNFYIPPTSCWGWATWKHRWDSYNDDASELYNRLLIGDSKLFNLGGAYDYMKQLQRNVTGEWKTWAVKWYASVFLNGGLSLHPSKSLTKNIGHDGSGTFSKIDSNYEKRQLGEMVDKYMSQSISYKAITKIADFYSRKIPINYRIKAWFE